MGDVSSVLYLLNRSEGWAPAMSGVDARSTGIKVGFISAISSLPEVGESDGWRCGSV